MLKKIKGLISHLVPRVGPRTWIFALIKDNLLPKAAVALAIWPVAEIILATMVKVVTSQKASNLTAAQVTTNMGISLSELASVTNRWWLMGAIITVGVVWLLSIIVRATYKYKKIEHPLVFGFGQLGWVFGAIMQALLGFVLVPLVIIFAILYYVPSSTEITFINTCFLAVAYVFVLASVHFLASIDRESENTILYIVQSSPDVQFNDASLQMLDAMNKEISDLNWIGSPEVVSLSKDGVVVLKLPLMYPADKWRKDECSQLAERLTKVEQAWKLCKLQVVHRNAPNKVGGKLGAII